MGFSDSLDYTEEYKFNDSIAMPSGSPEPGRLTWPAALASPWLAAPKKTSGLVQVDTARLMWLVKNDKPTW